jgi:hypothetical protein
MDGLVLPSRVFPGLYLGTEVTAASLPALRLLDITAVLNVGLPQCPNHFASDPHVTYCALDVFDNAASNFSSVFLNEAFPFVSAALERGQSVLVHCKSGLSKSPAVVAGLLMLRYNLPLLGALELVVESGQRVKISDHLLGELLLIADSKEGVEMAPHELPVEDKAEEGSDTLAGDVTKMLKEGDFASVAKAAESHPLLVRRCVLELPPVAMVKLEPFCSYLRRFAASVPCHVYACLQKDPADVGATLADLLDGLVRADVESNKEGVSLANVLFALEFVRNYESFASRFEELSRARFLDYFYRGDEEQQMDRNVMDEFARIAELRRLARKLGLMVRDLQSSVKEMGIGGGGRVLLAPQTVWGSAAHEGVCNIPEALAAFPLPTLPEGKTLHLQRHWGVVHAKFGSVTIAMPTDVFCVLEVFNHLDAPTRDEIYEMCRADRLDSILTALIAPVPRAKHALLRRLDDGRYEVNEAFDSRVRMLEIRL